MNPTPGQALFFTDRLFMDSGDAKIFRFTYQSESRLLHEFLLERYRFGRGEEWAHTFYPERVRLNGAKVNGGTRVRAGDCIAYLHLRADEPPPPPMRAPVYEDPWLLALNKPNTVPVNPTGPFYFTAMAIRAREHFAEPELTPLHRLDLETSGVLLFARRKAYISRFHQLFQQKSLEKQYRALVHGAFPKDLREISGKIIPAKNSSIHTKLALCAQEPLPARDGVWPPGTSFTRILEATSRGDFSALTLQPLTGKTNQLRVHLAHCGHPIVGDKKYYPDESVFLDWIEHRDFERLRPQLRLPRQALHCEHMAFEHPFTGESLTIHIPAPLWNP